MVSVFLSSLVVTLAAASSPADAFSSVPFVLPKITSLISAPEAAVGYRPLYASALDDASARAMSDYMAKSHEEKLKLQERKESEIQTLKAEIQQLKASLGAAMATTAVDPAPSTEPVPATLAPLAEVSAPDLESKLASAQSFISKYIVDAQNQKLLAVREAELNAEKKFQERMDKLFKANGIAPPSSSSAGERVDPKRVESPQQPIQKETQPCKPEGRKPSKPEGTNPVEGVVASEKLVKRLTKPMGANLRALVSGS